MAKKDPDYPRGSEWRIWDLHVHSPASFHWAGQRFHDMDAAQQKTSIDEMIGAMNSAAPAVFALMDYWTFDGWFALQERLKDADAPALHKKVFPGIELRLSSPTANYRLNAHVLFSDDTTDQQLRDFRTGLQVALVNRPLSDESLIELARNHAGADLLKKHGFDRADVLKDDRVGLRAGSTIAEVQAESYKNAIASVPGGRAIGFMPWDTSDGLAQAEWETHYAYVIGLMQASPIFETRKHDLWAAFVGVETPGNKNWVAAFQSALKDIPRLAVAGSDAHRYSDYGAFPSGKATWIKADPTFRGLLQAIREPARRSYIGPLPPKLKEVDENKTYFIDSLKIEKAAGSKLPEDWFDGSLIPLTTDLVAIIGNKGSGKSAFADVVALIGNSRTFKHFSFLSPNRFRHPRTMLARHFKATLLWRDDTPGSRLLSESAPAGSPELVRYIPQQFFEDLCNSHVEGTSNAFERELEAVIFAHTGEVARQGALDFDQLRQRQEQSPQKALVEFRKELHVVNLDIERIEEAMQPDRRRSVEELLVLKKKEMQEHDKVRPAAVAAPTEELTTEQRAATEELSGLAQQLEELTKEERLLSAEAATIAAKTRAAAAVKERIKIFKRQAKQFQEEISGDLATLGLTAAQVVDIRVEDAPITEVETAISVRSKELEGRIQAIAPQRKALIGRQDELKGRLNAPQRAYQHYLAAAREWEGKRDSLIGNEKTAESLKGLEERIAQLNALSQQLAEKKTQRRSLAEEVLKEIELQRQARAALFKPVQDVIDGNKLIRDDYKLQFKAALTLSTQNFSERLFQLIKQNFGPFKGEIESHNEVRKIVEQHDVDKGAALSMIEAVHDQIVAGIHGKPDGVGIERAMRVNMKPSALYDLLFGMDFIEPRYTLLFQETQIEHLSPGQRGALLLIFYLLVDTGHNPIILDQPEENLDNETIVSLLVPVLSEAKKRRQLIMVTHNPNLAVVCDAEQIIYSAFDRKDKSRIRYTSGAIESPQMNRHVVDVLEGTKMAFDNRGRKYH
jgi:hypothetical protein